MLLYDRNIIGYCSEIFGILGNLREFSENVRKRLCCLRLTFGESSGVLRKWSEIFGKSSKRHHWYVYVIK